MKLDDRPLARFTWIDERRLRPKRERGRSGCSQCTLIKCKLSKCKVSKCTLCKRERGRCGCIKWTLVKFERSQCECRTRKFGKCTLSKCMRSRGENALTKSDDLLQGTLDLMILKVVSLEPMHGWAIAQRIRLLSKDVLKVNQVRSIRHCIALSTRRGLRRRGGCRKITGVQGSTR